MTNQFPTRLRLRANSLAGGQNPNDKNRKMKKTPYLFLVFIIFFLILFLPSPAFAFWTYLRDAILFLPTLLIAVFLGFAILATGAFTWLMSALLGWVISPGFVSLSYTRPCGGIAPPANCNPIIEMGLNITQSFVNLALVVILVVIALSIALKLGEYGSKKIFVKLIIVALLVNFAPVLVGLIVDAANIVMHFFLDAIEEGAADIGAQVSDFGSGIAKAIFGAGGAITERLGLIMQGLTQIIVNVAMAIAFLLFGGLFLVRYVVLWTLTILSPLAFVFWILPATKKFWTMWWNQLIQWSVVGIPIAFFLYLALNSFSYLRSAFVGNLEMPGIEPATVGFFNNVFPFFVIIVFLYIGFTLGLQTGAMGASGVIGLTKKHGWAAAKWTGSESRRLAGRIAGDRGKKWMQRQAAAQLPGRTLLGKVAWGVGTLGAAPTYWALRRGIGEAGIHLTEAGRKDIRGAEKKYEGTTAENKVAAMRDIRFGWGNRIAALRQAVEEEQTDDIKRIMGPTADEEITKIGRASLRVHPDEFKEIRNAFPHLAEQMGQGFTEETRRAAKVHPQQAIQEGYASVQEGITARLKPNQIIKMDISQYYPDPITHQVSQAGQEIRAAMHTFWTGEQLGTAGKTFGRRFLTEFQNTINQQGAAWYQQHNPRLLQYLNSQAGQGLGLTPPP